MFTNLLRSVRRFFVGDRDEIEMALIDAQRIKTDLFRKLIDAPGMTGEQLYVSPTMQPYQHLVSFTPLRREMRITHSRPLTPYQVTSLMNSPYAHLNVKHACYVMLRTGKPAIFKLPSTIADRTRAGWWQISLTEDMTK